MAVIIFKAVERCNSNCIYCDVIKKRQEQTMSFDLLETVFRRIDEFLRAKPEQRVFFTWHGGEVGLLGAGYFATALELQNTFCAKTKSRIEHLVQSNLTLMTQNLAEAFLALGITQVGSSYEVIPHIRGFGPERDSEAYAKLFLRGTEVLDRNKIGWGVIYVVHRRSLADPLGIFKFLTNLSLRNNPNFNMVHVYGKDPHGLRIGPEEFADFLGAILPYWWERRDRFPNVKPFAGLLKNYTTPDLSQVCELSGACEREWVYIGPEGDASQCGRSGDYNLVTYGRIQDRSLADILADPQRDRFTERTRFLAEHDCRECRFWGICHGGCPLDAYALHEDFRHRSDACGFIRTFLEKYFEPVTGLRRDFYPSATARQGAAHA
jgi:uncharacterized protein